MVFPGDVLVGQGPLRQYLAALDPQCPYFLQVFAHVFASVAGSLGMGTECILVVYTQVVNPVARSFLPLGPWSFLDCLYLILHDGRLVPNAALPLGDGRVAWAVGANAVPSAGGCP